MPEPRLKILPYGSCSAHDPVYNLGQRGLAFPVWYRIHARETLYAHTIGEFIQLNRFLRGDLAIPVPIRRYICIDYDFEPGPEVRTELDEPDVILMEICTSENIKLDDWFIHRNQLPRLFMKPMVDSESVPGDAKKAVNAWWAALTNRKEAQQIEAAKIVAAHLPREVDDEVTRAVLFDARLVPDSRQELESGIDRFLSLQRRKQAVLIIHYRRFMPDGRAISWPPEFRTQLFAIARRLNMPVFDPAEMIAGYGVAGAISTDQLHYSKTFLPIVADAYWRIVSGEAARRQARPAPARPPAPSKPARPPWRLAPPFQNAEGHAWLAELPDDLCSDDPAQRIPLALFENGVALKPRNAMHRQICGDGAGAHAVWKKHVCFSASDGSDPNTNGRIYTLETVD